MESISTVILCGGHSRRMGYDKADLIYKKKTFLELIYEQCQPCKEIFISVGETDRYDPSIGIHIQDEFKHCGPSGGIHKAMLSMHAEWLFVTACDMPMMDFRFAVELYQQRRDDPDVIVPLDSDGKRHSIGALYHQRILPILEAELKNGNYRMMNLFEKLNVQYVSISCFEDERKLCNINQDEDYQQLLKEEVPVLSFIGHSSKSLIIQQVITMLSEKGVRVSYFKQCDDESHLMSTGAVETILITEHEMLQHKKKSMNLKAMIAQSEKSDIILLEGFEKENYPQCMVQHGENQNDEISGKDILIRIGSDSKADFSDKNIEAFSNWIIHWLRNK